MSVRPTVLNYLVLASLILLTGISGPIPDIGSLIRTSPSGDLHSNRPSEIAPQSRFLPQISPSYTRPLLPDGEISQPIFGNILVVYGDYENESGQEPVSVWVALFAELGFNASAIHINMLPNSPLYDVIVVIPSVGTSDMSFGVSLADAQLISAFSQPVLLFGYAHEVLDLLAGFEPATDFIPCLERYLWSSESSLQIYTTPHLIPYSLSRFALYSDHVHYDAYRQNSLSAKTEVLGTNYDGSGVQLLWYRAISSNPHIYYWGLDQVAHLTSYGKSFCTNFLLWLLRPPLQDRLGDMLASFQLVTDSPLDYWQVQGAGGFGYPLDPSLSFTYYVTDLVFSLGLEVNTTTFGPWLHASFNSSLGCFEDLGSPQRLDRCITTSMAVLTAQHLGILAQFDIQLIGNYLASCQDIITGGFFSDSAATSTSLMATYFAITALNAIGQLNKINTSSVIVFANHCQDLNPLSSEYGGFYATSSGGLVASLVNTLDAVSLLFQLGALDSINVTALVTYLKVCEEPSGSGIFDTRYTMSSNEWVLGTASALQILYLIGQMDQFNTGNGRTFILANQFANGGWGRGDTLHDFHNSPDETWYAVGGLVISGGLASPQENLTQYLSSCLSGWGGATEPTSFGDLLSSAFILSALDQADALSKINITAFAEYLKYCWSTPRTSFTAHQLPPGVGTDSDTPTPDRTAIEAGTFGPLYHYTYALLSSILHLSGDPWMTRNLQIRQEIESSQTFAPGYAGMLGLHHLYIGRETDLTFRFDTTCWSLLAHQQLGGQPADLINATAALNYLLSCLQGNSSHQYFHDTLHTVPLPEAWRSADGYLAETWLGLQALRYLDPSCLGIDGERLASYASQFLLGNLSLLTTYFATEILYLLTDTGLYTPAFTLLDQDALKTFLMDIVTYRGFVNDPNVPSGKWVPYLLDLALKLVHRLDLYSHLDCNPLLNLTQAEYSTGVFAIGEAVTFNGSVNELRWNLALANITVTANIFATSYTNSCSPVVQGLWCVHSTIPAKIEALGLQNLTLIAMAPGAIPCYLMYTGVCEVWGDITLETTYRPSLKLPRSLPLNTSILLTLTGAVGPDAVLTTGTITITIETVPLPYYPTHQGMGRYDCQILTDDLAPRTYLLSINASAPYCNPVHTTDWVTIIVFDTSLTLEQIQPATPTLHESITLHIELKNDSDTPLSGCEVHFNITGPGDIVPSQMYSNTTNGAGLVVCTWVPDRVGQWLVDYAFNGYAMYAASEASTNLLINRRPLSCAIQLLPSSTLFVGNHSQIQVEVKDVLNGSHLSGMLINFYEGSTLLDTAITDASGLATCEWLVTLPLGYRTLHLEISETSTYTPWTSSDLQLLVRDAISINMTTSSTQLYLGETIDLSVWISTFDSPPPDGTASLYWDGHWQQDFPITQGSASTSLFLPYSGTAGIHLLIVRFGHLDVPDIYTESSISLSVDVLAVIEPSLTLSVDPLEVDNSYLTPRITIQGQLIYADDTHTYGLQGNLTLELRAEDTSLIYSHSLTTNNLGFYRFEISTPQPGVYLLTVEYRGQRGFAPCTQSTPFLVRVPLNPMSFLFSPLVLASLAFLGIGGILGGSGFLMLRKRSRQLLDLFSPERVIAPSRPILSIDSEAITEGNSEG